VRLLRSLRFRIIAGSLLWTCGLLAIAHMIAMAMVDRFPAMTRFDHRAVVTVALILLGTGLLGLRSGLAPFRQLRGRLAAVRTGSDSRVEGAYPSEVQPLVNDLNSLLEHRERVVKRALATAGDLAHGLKTPLAILEQEAERARRAGHEEFAAGISQQVERMRRQVDYHLAHARAAASGAGAGARCALRDAVEALGRTLRRLYAGRAIEITIHVPAGDSVRCQREDLDEMLGNLLDNAFKWARSRVTVESAQAGDAAVITVDDDGPGLALSMREAVLQRGVRADESAPGSGLGLAIVRDLAELYGGSVSLCEAPGGGLRTRLELPRGRE
jgi:signal transduction histidine kinase